MAPLLASWTVVVLGEPRPCGCHYGCTDCDDGVHEIIVALDAAGLHVDGELIAEGADIPTEWARIRSLGDQGDMPAAPPAVTP